MKSEIYNIFKLGHRKFFFVTVFLFSLLNAVSCVKDHNFEDVSNKPSDVKIDLMSYATRSAGNADEKKLHAKICGLELKKEADGQFIPNNSRKSYIDYHWFSDIEFTYKDKYSNSEDPYKPVKWLNLRRPTYNDDKDIYTAMFAWSPAIPNEGEVVWFDSYNNRFKVDILCSQPFFESESKLPHEDGSAIDNQTKLNPNVCKGNKECFSNKNSFPKLDFKHVLVRLRFKLKDTVVDEEYKLVRLKKITVKDVCAPAVLDLRLGRVFWGDKEDAVVYDAEQIQNTVEAPILTSLLGKEIGEPIMIVDPSDIYPGEDSNDIPDSFTVEMLFEEQMRVGEKMYTGSFTYSQKVPYKSPNGVEGEDIKAGRDCLINLSLKKMNIRFEVTIKEWDFEELVDQTAQ